MTNARARHRSGVQSNCMGPNQLKRVLDTFVIICNCLLTLQVNKNIL